MELSKLEKIELREVWEHEARDFTNWLAQPENLELLSDEMGIALSLIGTEASVGRFNVDILAEEDGSGRKIIIENQLGYSDHRHLGQIITYASGYDAEIIIWIVKEMREEHKQAVNWLNEHSHLKINLFAIQMEVWKIGDSPPAAKFHIVAQPNNWTKNYRETTASGNLSERKKLNFAFWTQFREYAQARGARGLKLRNPHSSHDFWISLGSSLAHIVLTISTQKGKKDCQLYIHDSKPLFEELYKKKQEIEKEFSGSDSLVWEPLPSKKGSRIKLTDAADLYDEKSWGRHHQWMYDKLMKFKDVFGARVKQFSGGEGNG